MLCDERFRSRIWGVLFGARETLSKYVSWPGRLVAMFIEQDSSVAENMMKNDMHQVRWI